MPLALGSSFTKASAGASSVKRMYRGTVSAWNADAADWVSRVYAAGASVSSSTANAVTAFCNAIDAAGIRERFYRLNLFCGTGLNACLVPLYRGPSLSGTQYGGATDINTGPFVGGDYSESVGLSAGSSAAGKYLTTGFAMSALPTTSIHLGVWFKQSSGTGHSGSRHIGVVQNSQTWSISGFVSTSLGQSGAASSAAASGMAVASRASNTSAFLYMNGAIDGTSTTSTLPVLPTADLWVFQVNNNGSPVGFQTSVGPIVMYSVGLHINAQQAADFYAAANTFKAALGR